jgi:hypothetical protein
MHIISERCACHYCRVNDDDNAASRLEKAAKAFDASSLLGPGSLPFKAEHRAALNVAMSDVANRASSMFNRPASAASAGAATMKGR